MVCAKAQPETVARQLFDRLLRGDWTQALEDEAFALVGKLQPSAAELDVRIAVTAGAVRQLGEQLFGQRVKAALDPSAELEKLSREMRRDRTAKAR